MDWPGLGATKVEARTRAEAGRKWELDGALEVLVPSCPNATVGWVL